MPRNFKSISFNGFDVELRFKSIKNLNLYVCPPDGQIRVSAPKGLSTQEVKAFLISKSTWIKQKQQKYRSRTSEAALTFLDGEIHYYCGTPYQLHIIEHNEAGKVKLIDGQLTMQIRPDTSIEKRLLILNNWYRQQLKNYIPPIIRKYETLMRVTVNEFRIKRMKTRWGSCNPHAKRIWINLELAKKPAECLEYIVVHEMVHLLEASHNLRFKALMGKYMPHWKQYRKKLNQLPVS